MRRFQDLMPHRVRRILLVQSLYESFILTEDGQLNDAILRQFVDLNLNQNPDLIRVSTAEEALDVLAKRPIDMIVASMQVGEMNAAELARKVRQRHPKLPLLVLAYNNRQLIDFLAHNDTSAIERVFLWQGDTRVLLAMVKYVEDRLNVESDSGGQGVPIILVVEDNVRFYSSFLPVIYAEVLGHSQSLIDEGVNLAHKMLRTRARPKILLCTDFEEAWSYFERFEGQVLGIISDVEFPCGGELDRRAGVKLLERVRERRADIPVVLQSSIAQNQLLAGDLDAQFLLKGSQLLLDELRTLLVESFGFGDFVFRDQEGNEVGRAADLPQMIEQLAIVPGQSLRFHAGKNNFSNWLKARTEYALAERLRAKKVDDFATTQDLRDELIGALSHYRHERDKVVVADFREETYDGKEGLYRIGGGSLGGKARGLAFVNRLLNETRVASRFEQLRIHVPHAAIVATDVFDRFLKDNELKNWAIECDSDRKIEERFLATPFPQQALDDVRRFLIRAETPLAIRSSGLLEDSPYQPFAGVYKTYMLPNNNAELERRLVQVVSAIKRVYASTFTKRAKSYLAMTPYRLEEEKMAVILQEVVGSRRGDRYYPDFAGVARSHNFYPTPPLTAGDGIAAVAAGLGCSVVQGANCFRFSPTHPQVHLGGSSIDEILGNSQRSFCAIDLEREPDVQAAEGAELLHCDIDELERQGVLQALGSTYSPENDRLSDGLGRPGVRVITFAPLLKHRLFPIAELLQALLEIGEAGTLGPVEIEFAVRLTGDELERPEFGFLQMRPLAMASEAEASEIGHVLASQLICRSECVLGNGRIDDIVDLVVVDRERFDRSRSHEVAAEIARLNAALQDEGRPYLLIGVGRWGSMDPLLGIPVSWHEIAGARAIVECGFKDMHVAPSQGSHFFQNLSSCHVGYFSVQPELGEGFLDWGWLQSEPEMIERGLFVDHLRLAEPILIKMDGRIGEGVILKPGAES